MMNQENDRKTEGIPFLVLKKALPYFLPFFLLSGLILYTFHAQEFEEERSLIEAGEKRHLERVDEAISNLLSGIAVDLKMLSAHHEMEAALETNDDRHLGPLTKEFVTFSEIKGFYDQIRLLDLKGRERIRVNLVEGKPFVVPPEMLQNKSQRSYFKAVMRLQEGASYLSPFELNIEQTQVEHPLKPVLRIGVPIFGLHGKKRGALILNYLGINMLDHLRKHREKIADTYLFVASDDFWLRSPIGEDKWQFIFPDASHPTFQERFPQVWQRISETESGQFFARAYLITYREINPSLHLLRGMANQFSSLPGESNPEIKALSWKLLSIVPTALVYENSNKGSRKYLLIFALIGVVLGMASFFIAQTRVKRELAKQRRFQVEREREAMLAELESKNAELERFTYTVSHDLKSPLITINGFLGLLEKDISSGKTSEIQSDIKRISKAAIKMKGLLDELLELSRIGRPVNPPKKVPLGDLVHEAIALVKGQLDRRNIRVRVASDLPTVYVDATRIREVLQNLIDNAAKFMGNQPRALIEIGSRRNKGEVIVTVRDNGIGLDSKYHETIFGIFNRLDQSGEGTGVGLAIVKRVIEVHHGRVWVESDGPGKGSTFCCALPEKARLDGLTTGIIINKN